MLALPLAIKSLLQHNPAQLDAVSRPDLSPNAVIRAMHPLPQFDKRKTPEAGITSPLMSEWGEPCKQSCYIADA